MKKFIAIMMILGLVGFAMAQDLDAPVSGTPVPAADNGGENASIYDMLVARMRADRDRVLGEHIAGWWNFEDLGYIGDWMAEWNQNIWGSNQDWQYFNDNLSAAEKAAINQLASEIHNPFVAAGLN